MKKRFLAVLLSGVMAFSGSITAAAFENEAASEDNEDIVITDDAVEEADDAEDEILIEDEESATAASSEEENYVDALEADSDTGFGYYHFEGEDDFDSVMEGAEEAGYNVVQDKYPSSYINPKLPYLRNQNPFGSCWAHSIIALAEINLLKKDLVQEADLSELHLAYFAYNSVVDPLGGTKGDIAAFNPDYKENFLDFGGNSELALHTLARWEGAADEDEFPYDSAYTVIERGLDDRFAYKDKAHLKSFYKEHYRVDDKPNLDAIKELITRYGAVSISYDHHNAAYHAGYNSYYNPGNRSGSGHAITIVGWDDNFSRQNFKDVPEGNGAWLVRNSWYSGYHQATYSLQGYFWMSYYETTISNTVYAAEFDTASDYSHNYQYDGGSYSSSFMGTKFGNIFKSSGKTGAEALKAVSFETPESNLEYKISIYTDLKLHLASSPTAGKLVTTVTGKTDYAGYYTVPLPKPVYMPKGTYFSVVIECQDNTKKFRLACETDASRIDSEGNEVCTFSTDCEEGQGFLVVNGIWRDFSEYYKGCEANFRIKAFTDDTAYVNPTSISFDKSVYDLKGIAQYEPKVTVGPENATDKRYTLTSSNPDIVEIYEETNIIINKPGTVTLTATTKAGNLKATAKVNVLPTYNFKIVGETNLTKGYEYTYRVEFDPPTTKETVAFSSSDTKVITIDKNSGKAKAVGAGKAEVLASVGGMTAHHQVTVYPSSVSVAYKVEDDNTVSLLWQNTGAEFYSVEENGKVLATNINADSSGTCRFTDKRYAGKPNADYLSLNYRVVANEKGLKNVTLVTVNLNKIFTISYELNGGQNDPANPSTYTSATPDIVFKNPTKKGCEFEGWYRSSSYREKVTTIKKGSSGNVTLYAKWNPYKYTIAFNGNGANGSMASMTKLECGKAYALKPNFFEKKGYVFKNWNTKKDGSGQAIGDGASVKDLATVDGSVVTLYAQWNIQKYKITYVLNGGNPVSNPTEYTAATPTIKLLSPTKAGYTFAGWYKDSEYKKKVTSIAKGSTGDITLYAKWTSFTYNIKFNGSKATGGSMPVLKKCEYYDTYQLPANKFKKKGYDFLGWNTKQDGTGTSFADGASVKKLGSRKGETVTLYAQWKLNTYSISYVLDGGKNASENPATYNVTTKTIKLQKPVREGYTFGGWFKQYDGSKFMKKASQIAKGSAGDVTLYAKWTMNKYSITFNGNKSTGGKMAKLTKCEYFARYTLPENSFVKKGYEFTGWNTKKDGTGIAIRNKEELYKPSFVIKNGQNITLYAQWRVQQ